MTNEVDILIVGGGVNGAGIARDAAGRGFSVMLVENGDLAGGTSSKSTKMIHGGLRYLEYYEFGLVRQALKEREILLRIAPHLIAPLRIVLPVLPGMRPAWLIRLGLWLYDHIGGHISLPGTSSIRLTQSNEGAPLQPGAKQAFAYSDGWVDDARLVAINARDAHLHGADIRTRTELVSCTIDGDHWLAHLKTPKTEETISARMVVNAAGPWADKVDGMAGFDHAAGLIKVQGSHIVLPKLYEGDYAYLLQNLDKRVLFAIPFQGKYTLFGTTDTPIEGDPGAAAPTREETQYLLNATNGFFRKQVTSDDIVWSYAGVRPLFGDPKRKASALSRDYHLVMDPPGERPPFLSVLGGKITTYRSLSEKAANMICARLGNEQAAWTAHSPLPGGELGSSGMNGLLDGISRNWPFLDHQTVQRLASAYGTDVYEIFSGCETAKDMDEEFAPGFYAREAHWMLDHEFAHTVTDMLWRRSKLGLRMDKSQVNKLAKWLQAQF